MKLGGNFDPSKHLDLRGDKIGYRLPAGVTATIIGTTYEQVIGFDGSPKILHDGTVFDGTGNLRGTKDDRSLTGLSEIRFEGPATAAPAIRIAAILHTGSTVEVDVVALDAGTSYRLTRSTNLQDGFLLVVDGLRLPTGAAMKCIDSSPPDERAFYRVEEVPRRFFHNPQRNPCLWHPTPSSIFRNLSSPTRNPHEIPLSAPCHAGTPNLRRLIVCTGNLLVSQTVALSGHGGEEGGTHALVQ